MWDTKQSDYKITGPDCPFHTHRYADICRHLFDAFRREGLAIGAYFSKADWHCPDYWVPGKRKPPWRGPGYDPGADPARWEQFVQFTHNQILELTGQYGRIDILWLDAGWVNAANGQDIRLGQVVDKARQTQPWLICADRTVGGPYENYVTPEQTVPSEPLGIPWESCITLGTAFSFRYEDTYKSLEEIITLLVDVVAKGGNLALNVAPQPDGRLPAGAIFRLEALGRWLQRYGEAIYGTRALAPFRQGPFAFTRKNQVVYIFCLDPASAAKGELAIPLALPVSQVDLVAGPMALPFTQDDASIRVTLRRRRPPRIRPPLCASCACALQLKARRIKTPGQKLIGGFAKAISHLQVSCSPTIASSPIAAWRASLIALARSRIFMGGVRIGKPGVNVLARLFGQRRQLVEQVDMSRRDPPRPGLSIALGHEQGPLAHLFRVFRVIAFRFLQVLRIRRFDLHPVGLGLMRSDRSLRRKLLGFFRLICHDRERKRGNKEQHDRQEQENLACFSHGLFPPLP